MNNQLLNVFRFNKVFWWIIFSLVILNLVFFTFIARAQKNSIVELQEAYNTKRRAHVPQIDSNQQKFIKAKEDIQTFKETLPSRTEFADIAAELFEILRRNQLKAGKIIYKPESVESHGLWQYSTSFTLNGKYSALKAFLADIQESKTLFCIEGLSFSNRLGEEESVDMKVTITTYFSE
jgi:Tfp pilus assembly protein PilO